jgi:hypothetical protein
MIVAYVEWVAYGRLINDCFLIFIKDNVENCKNRGCKIKIKIRFDLN